METSFTADPPVGYKKHPRLPFACDRNGRLVRFCWGRWKLLAGRSTHRSKQQLLVGYIEDGEPKASTYRRLVLECHAGLPPHPKSRCRSVDGDIFNWNPENLRWE